MKEQQIVANLNQWQVEVIWEEQTASHNLLQKSMLSSMSPMSFFD